MTSITTAAGWVLLALALPATAQLPPSGNFYRYQCEGGKTFEVVYVPEQARLTLAGREPITLPQIETGSGARYSDGSITLLTKGTDAFIEEDGRRTYSGCAGLLSESGSASPAQPVRGLW